MGFLTSSDLDGIHSIVHEVLKDNSLGSRTILFRMTGVTVSTFDPTTQAIPDMYTESSVSAFKGSYALQEIQSAENRDFEGSPDALIELGDVKFIVNVSDVTGVLSVDDQIFESGTTMQSATTYEVKSISKDPLNMAYFIQSRSI